MPNPDNDRDQRRQQQQQGEHDQRAIGKAAEQAVLRIAPAGDVICADGNGFAQPLA